MIVVFGAAVSIVQVNERGGRVGVACGVGRAHLEGVRAVAQAGVALGRAAGGPAAAVELALERRAALVGAEGEGGAGRVGRVARLRRDRRVRRRGVDREGAGRRSCDVARGVGRAQAHGVRALGGEVRAREGERPRGGARRGAPVLGAVGEGGAVPVLVVRVALDRELDVLQRCTAGVRRGAREVAPAGQVVEPCRRPGR